MTWWLNATCARPLLYGTGYTSAPMFGVSSPPECYPILLEDKILFVNLELKSFKSVGVTR